MIKNRKTAAEFRVIVEPLLEHFRAAPGCAARSLASCPDISFLGLQTEEKNCNPLKGRRIFNFNLYSAKIKGGSRAARCRPTDPISFCMQPPGSAGTSWRPPPLLYTSNTRVSGLSQGMSGIVDVGWRSCILGSPCE